MERLKEGRGVVALAVLGLIFFIALIVLAFGCGPTYETVTIDGCEYIRKAWSENQTLTHKGNCTNPIHWRKLEQ